MIKILFGILSTHERDGWHHPTITQFFSDLAHTGGQDVGWNIVPIHQFIPAAAGRNVFCYQAKDTDCDWLCMIDNDMTLPPNLLDAVKKAPVDADVVCPTFYMWDQTKLRCTLCWGTPLNAEESKMDRVVKAFAPGYHELTKCGTGVLFIKPHVFRKMEYPYFRYTYDEHAGMTGTEDIQFCYAAREKGFKIYGTTEVKVGHNKTVDLLKMWEWLEIEKKANIPLDSRLAAVAK